MKIDIYTLLGMIKDGKAPKKIVYKNEVLHYDDEYPATYNYYDEEGNNQLFDGNIGEILNDEVEILETTITYNQDNRIEKIDIDGYALSPTGVGKIEFTISEKILANKINEIIDYIKKEKQ